MYFTYKGADELKVTSWEKTPGYATHKQLRGAILISNKDDFRRRIIITKGGGTLHNGKESIHQEHVIEPQNT